MASNVWIKNGFIDCTSHHGIVLIEIIIKAQNFETHGIELNGCDNIVWDNIAIGPTSSIVFFNGKYRQDRFLIRIYKQIAKELVENEEFDDEDQYIQFYESDEATTMQEIINELQVDMNMTLDCQ